MENWTKSYLCMVVPFLVQILPFYRQKPNLQDPGKIRGANAPPNLLTKPWKCGFGRVSAARVWPSGHTQGGDAPWFHDMMSYLTGFAVLGPGFDETSFYLQLLPIDL